LDEAVTQVWASLSLSSDEQSSRTDKLRSSLDSVYHQFVLSQYAELDQLKQSLTKAKRCFAKAKERYNDNKIAEPKTDSVSITDQIRAFEKATQEVHQQYEGRSVEIHRLHIRVTKLFDELDHPRSERGEFADEDPDDLTQGKLERLKQRLSGLKAEKSRRSEVIGALKYRFERLLFEMQEEPPESLQDILAKDQLTLSAMDALEKAANELQRLKSEREHSINRLKGQIGELHRILGTSSRQRKRLPNEPSRETIQALQKELASLERDADEELPRRASQYQHEVERLSNDLHVAEWKRPKYHGSNSAEAIKFYRQAVSELRGLSEEREKILEMAKSPDHDDEQTEAAIQEFKAKTGSRLSIQIRKDSTTTTTTELSLSSALFAEPQSITKGRTATPRSVKQLFEPVVKKEVSLTPSKQLKSNRSSSPQRRREVVLRSRDPFRH
jgi:hypothetical protein